MQTIKIESLFFSAKDTLECGQVFRFKPYKKGYLVISLDKACYIYEKDNYTYIETEDKNYFENYFDLGNDYSKIYDRIFSFNDSFINKALNLGKGIRILRQNVIETAFSFIISQNNNIKRIKSTIENLCKALGEKKSFMGEDYYSFPTVDSFLTKPLSFYKEIGLGYRDEYFLNFANFLKNGYDLQGLSTLTTSEIEKELLKIKGIGKKVADCIILFGFSKSDSFPVDTWIEKLYKENLKGKELDRAKISKELSLKYKDLSGYVQQYLFYYKRSLENGKSS